MRTGTRHRGFASGADSLSMKNVRWGRNARSGAGKAGRGVWPGAGLSDQR
jgi:hypothetical protein